MLALEETGTALSQQIVTATPSDGSPNELAHRRRFGQNDACIDIWSIAFTSGDMWLLNEQFEFASNFLASNIMGDRLLHRHRRPIPRVLDLCGNLPWHSRRARTLFL